MPRWGPGPVAFRDRNELRMFVTALQHSPSLRCDKLSLGRNFADYSLTTTRLGSQGALRGFIGAGSRVRRNSAFKLKPDVEIEPDV